MQQTVYNINTIDLKANAALPGSVLVKASWHSGGLLRVEANACNSAEVAIALSNNL